MFKDNVKFDAWLKEKYNIDGWRHYYYLKEVESGWSREKIHEELDNLEFTMRDEERDKNEFDLVRCPYVTKIF